MNKILFFLLTCLFAFGAENSNWQHQHRFILKKDELAKVQLLPSSSKDDDGRNLHDSFDFRWTLYINENIIVHTKYRKFPRQLTMSLRRGLETYAQFLLPEATNPPKERSRLLLVFEEYDAKNELATFDVYIEDSGSRLEVKFIEPRKKN